MKEKIYKKWWFILLLILIYTILIIGVTYLMTVRMIDKKEVEVTNNQSIGQNDDKDKEEVIEQTKEVSVKEKIEEKDWEVTIKEAGFKQDIVPSKPDSFYTHYQVKDTDNTYFYLIIEAKNISSLGLRADTVAKVKMKYDNKYEYDTFSTIEENGGGTFTYTNITNIDPLTNRKLYYLVEVPKTIEKEKSKPITAEIIINENTYNLKIR